MAKKQTSSSEPVVAEEPPRPEEQFKLDEGTVAPPSSYVSRRERAANAPKTYGARSARERRAGRAPRGDSPRREKVEAYSAETVADLLENPTLTVSEAQLRAEYSYVIADIRSMALLSAGLIAALIVLAQVLPK